ncbi:uncharacterized protein BJ171DRAFT_490333 [Polychytrium aggregatum]|uniref:uncharacterized protein n=1 Tax=Polychytrium aggregatum TaxID=110093 RepID=UPI0022FF178F|nr:uncharacterized protein BJ171DRAFT_490333 [Polychytrium aggregatum]KAI9208139.1 hypothetical protein BJ171DRAFT_490333 [Polychytrium aggregatum]
MAGHARVPLIKFLGPRRLLTEWPHQSPRPGQLPAAPIQPKPAAASAAAAGQQRSATLSTSSQLPRRFWKRPISESEINAVELGGAGLVY